jgi:hypothetical protein
VEEGSGMGKFSPGVASANLKAKLAEAINSLHDANGEDAKDE